MQEPRPIELVARLRALSREGSRAERRLAEQALADISFATLAPIKEFAERADVSEPTVTRFCRALGCAGVREFKLGLAQVRAIGGLYMFPEPHARDADARRIVSSVFDSAISALERVRDAADMDAIGIAGRALAGARQVAAFGSGGVSSLAAVEMQTRLFRYGIPVAAHIDGQMQRMAASVLRPGDACIAFSASGEVASLVDAARLAREGGAAVVAVTRPNSPLWAEAGTAVAFPVPADSQVLKPTSGRYSLLMLLDLIATVAGETMCEAGVENLRRVRASLSQLDMSDPCRPIGD